MKRILTVFLSFLLLLGLILPVVQVSAADSTSVAGAVTTASGPLNVRASASGSSSIVGSLRKGSYITLISKSGSWWKVEYTKGQYGYCHADYITPVEGTPVEVKVSSSLNVRSGAGTSYPVQGSLNNGEYVLRLSQSGTWSRILYHGTKTGWVSSQYLGSGTAPGNSAISLNVPSYKQTDSRWSGLMIGSSGKTMAQIGCATTAIAMMESYRTGKAIYPDDMARQLRYTPSGSVYWPSHYTVTTASANYLERILTILQQGKSVLFGAKNSYGSQHWVVITGFTGGRLTASNFSIQDPGSHSRTTLQQFLNVYPNFYKYFTY